MLVLLGLIFLETMYIWFHLDETSILSFFIKSLSSYKKNSTWQLIY
jgi:hypothetical protein